MFFIKYYQQEAYISPRNFLINLPRPFGGTNVLLKCVSIVSFLINISFLLALRKIELMICSCSFTGYFLISSWSIVLYCFKVCFVSPLLIMSKFTIFQFLKCESVSSRNSLHLLRRYHVSSPSCSYHFKLLGINFGTNVLSTFYTESAII